MNQFELHSLRFDEDEGGPTPAPQPLRCLMVEDSRFDRSLLRYAADRSDLAVTFTEAASLAEAKTYLAGEAFDLVILDQSLPDGEGLTLAEEMAADPRLAAIPRLMVSGSEDTSVAERARAAGCAAFVAKQGLSLDGFAEVLRTLCTRPAQQATAAPFSEGMSLLLGDLEITGRHQEVRQVIARLAGLLMALARQGRDPAMVEEVSDLAFRLWMEVEGPEAPRDAALTRFD
ncbi:MAG: response regulator [Pseudomonadota bacterium]